MKRSGQSSRRETGMRSVILHDFLLSLRSLIPVGILGLILFTALFPFSAAGIRDISIFNIEYTHQQLKFRFCASGTEPFITAAAVFLGAAASIRLFSFMQDKKRSSFFFSLGMTRKQLYFVRTLSGLLVLSVSAVLPLAVSLMLNIKALGYYEGMIPYAAVTGLLVIMQAAAGMMIGGTGCFLSGTAAETLLVSVTAAAAPSVLISTLNELMKTFLWGNVYDVYSYSGTLIKEGMLSGLSLYNPVCFSWKLIEKYGSFTRTMADSRPDTPDLKPVLGWLCALILLSVFLYFLFEKYKAERSGISGLFAVAKAAVSIVWPCAAFAVVLKALQNTGTVMAFGSSVICAVILFVIAAGSFSMKSEKMRKKLLGIAGIVWLLLVSAVMIRTGFFGLYNRIPDSDQIKSVQVTFAGDPSLMPDQCSMTQNGQGLYSTGTVSLNDPESMTAVMELEKQMTEQGKAALASSEDASQTVYPYDIEISWTDRKGKKHLRYYDRIRASILTGFLRLEDLPELKTGTGETVKGLRSDRLWNSETFLNGEIYVSDPWMRTVKHLTLSEDMRGRLLQTAAEGLSAQESMERYHPRQDAVCCLYFTLNGESDLSSMKYGSSQTKIYLTDQFGQTLSLLTEWNALPDLTAGLPLDEIQSVQLQKFDPYSGMNQLNHPVSLFFSEYRTDSDQDFVIGKDFGTRPSFTEENQIADLAAASVSGAFMDDSGCLAVFKMKSGSCIYRYIPYEKEPDFIREKIN